MNKAKNYLAALVVLAVCGIWLLNKEGVQAEDNNGAVACYSIPEEIKLTARQGKSVWNGADQLVDFLKYPSEYRLKSTEQTRIAFLHDSENLYILCQAEVSKTGLSAIATNQDGAVYQDDNIQIFIQPRPDSTNYYVILVNPLGTLWDARKEVREDGCPADISWNSEAKASSEWKNGDLEWTFTLRIPLKSFAAQIKEGAVWKINVTRTHLHNRAVSSWVYLKSPGSMPFPKYFYPMVFSTEVCKKPKELSNIRGINDEINLGAWCLSGSAETNSNHEVLLKTADAAAFQKLSVKKIGGRRFICASRFKSGQNATPVVMKLCYEDINGDMREMRPFEYIRTFTNWTEYVEDVAFPETAGRLKEIRLERGAGKGTVAVDGIYFATDTLRADHQPRQHLYDSKSREVANQTAELAYRAEQAAIARDVSLPIIFDYQTALPRDAKVRIVVDLPPEITDPFVYALGNLSGAVEKREQVSINEITYQRYAAPVTNKEQWVYLFVKARGRVGKIVRLGYYLEWDGGRQTERWLDAEVIAMPSESRLKHYQIVMPLLTREWELKNIPGYTSLLKRAGINGIELWGTTNSTPYTASMVNYFRTSGFFIIGSYCPPGAGYHQALMNDPDMQAKDINGKPVKSWHGLLGCPSYRGAAYQNGLDYIREFARLRIDTINHDEEFFDAGEAPRNICFCARCKTALQKYLQQHLTNLPAVTMEAMSRNPGKYPEQEQAWYQCRADLVTEWFRDYRKVFEEEWSRIEPGRKLTMYSSSWDDPDVKPERGENELIMKFCDNAAKLKEGLVQCLAPQPYLCYANYGGLPREVGHNLIKLQAKWGPYVDNKQAVFPYILVGGPGGMCFVQPQRVLKYQIYEVFTTGAVRGCVLWLLKGMDGYLWKYLGEALNTIAKVEDVLWEGKVEPLICATPGAEARAVHHGDKTVILVTHYAYDPVEVTVNYQTDKDAVIADVETGEILAKTGPNKKSFKVKLDRERARLLRVKRI